MNSVCVRVVSVSRKKDNLCEIVLTSTDENGKISIQCPLSIANVLEGDDVILDLVQTDCVNEPDMLLKLCCVTLRKSPYLQCLSAGGLLIFTDTCLNLNVGQVGSTRYLSLRLLPHNMEKNVQRRN